MQYWEEANPRHFADVFASAEAGGYTLAALLASEGKTRFNAMMVKWMTPFLRFFSVFSMDAELVAETIELILEEYPHLMVDDLKLFFKQAKKGCYGEVYGRFDGNVILAWMRKYHRARQESQETYRRQRRNRMEAFKTIQEKQQEIPVSFEENKKRAEQGYRNLMETLAGSRFGPGGDSRSRLDRE